VVTEEKYKERRVDEKKYPPSLRAREPQRTRLLGSAPQLWRLMRIRAVYWADDHELVLES
jgi:hypothetical protein